MKRRIQVWIYRQGHRPRPGSFWYSPSLELIFTTKHSLEHVFQGWEKIRGHRGY